MFHLALWTGLGIIMMACAAEYIDSTLGMGYGTSLTPLLLMMGFEPLQVVPAILLSELFTGFLAGGMHAMVGNVNFKVRTLNPVRVSNGIRKHGLLGALRIGISQHLKIALTIGSLSIIGSIFGVKLAINLPPNFLKLYIGTLVLVIGIYILITLNKSFKFSWPKLTAIAIIASFNKGLSGGGYGPVVTGGQVLAGVEGKNAVAITSLAEALTCIVGLIAYYLASDAIDWTLAPYLLIGGLLSVPLSAFSVKKIRMDRMKALVGIATIFLGIFTLSKLLFQ